MPTDTPKSFLPLILMGGLLIAAVTAALVFFEQEPVDLVSSASTKRRCNIGVISIDRQIDTRTTQETISSLTIAQGIRNVSQNNGHVGFVILMNSPGGSATAAEEIADAISDIDAPTVALVRGSALSGGYWVATAADYIVALSTSSIGNIGVTSSYLQQAAYNEKEGYQYEELTTGRFKDVANENKELSHHEREFLLNHLNDVFSVFANTVMQNRNLSPEQFASVNDGKFYIAQEALKLGLIDEVGGLSEVKTYLASHLSLTPDAIILCEPSHFE